MNEELKEVYELNLEARSALEPAMKKLMLSSSRLKSEGKDQAMIKLKEAFMWLSYEISEMEHKA